MFLGRILHVTHDLSILGKPYAPRIPELIKRPVTIVLVPNPLVLLRQVFPCGKVALHHLTAEDPGILDEHINVGFFPLPEPRWSSGTIRIHQTVGVDKHTLRPRASSLLSDDRCNRRNQISSLLLAFLCPPREPYCLWYLRIEIPWICPMLLMKITPALYCSSRSTIDYLWLF